MIGYCQEAFKGTGKVLPKTQKFCWAVGLRLGKESRWGQNVAPWGQISFIDSEKFYICDSM